ncbi:hypothetical protein FGO68_gene14279 [Halteria grandinella]|uniref:MORN repeat protein n=1 Tax=Halteria grandinella TaxID=5974 RepID=A0A8J8NLG0_HALGN|nr:hypothetical protein FGO68_gene14279 [Halteria grandinella]
MESFQPSPTDHRISSMSIFDDSILDKILLLGNIDFSNYQAPDFNWYNHEDFEQSPECTVQFIKNHKIEFKGYYANATYYGQTRLGVKHGIGILLVPHLDYTDTMHTYEAIFRNGYPVKGRILTNGDFRLADLYKGDIEKNYEKNGKGELINYYAQYKYEGRFERDQFIGEGSLTYFNGDRYEGNFFNGYLRKGKCFYSNKDYYEGGFFFDTRHDTYQRNGEGKYWSGGDCWDGEWNRDKKSGDGTLTFADGSFQKGVWDVKPIGIHQFFGADGVLIKEQDFGS